MNSNIRNQVNLQGQLIMMGAKGDSAYEVAVQQGFEGTVDEWLESLKGADGKNGIDGEPGLSSTIQVGTVTTLDSDENATVSNSGTETNAVFNFGIPRGKEPNIFFNNIYDMKQANLKVGMIVKTLGYYEINDGGSGTYYIRTKTDDDIDDGGSIHILNNDLVAELIVDDEINIKQFGAKGDGIVDDTEVIQKVLNIGGSIFIPVGTYKITEELIINISNTTISGNGINKSILKYEGNGTQGNFLTIKGIDADNYIENVFITRITIDCTQQWYKGGNSDETPKETSPNPRYRGLVGIEIRYSKNVTIEDIIMNDIYGDGIIIIRSSHCVINRNKLYDCGSGNIMGNDYTGWDNHGDGIVSFSSYNIDISNNIVINKRVYLTHEIKEGATKDAYGLPCGRSGLEFEYKINVDSPSSNPDNHPTYNAPGYDEFTTRDGFGLRMSNNYVYGYTKGIHLEASVRCLIDSNKMIKNHIAILHSGGELTHIINNYISNEGLSQAPQIGYNVYSGGIAITSYASPSLVLIDGNIIDITSTIASPGIQAISLGRSCIRISNNSIKTNCYGIYEMASVPKAITKGVFITNNEFYANTNKEISVCFIYKYYSNADWVISGNSFTDKGDSIGMANVNINSQKKTENGGVLINNNIFNNTIIKEVNQGCNINIINNVFYVLSNFIKGERPIYFSATKNVNIENNKFYVHEGNEIDYCIFVRDSSNGLSIIKNIFYISNNVMDSCCRLYNYLDYFVLKGNIVETTSNNLSLVKCNWVVTHPIITDNRINNPELNYIILAVGGSASGLININNNMGKIKLNINSNYKKEGSFIPIGFLLKDYSNNENKIVYGEVCVVEGTYTKNTWKASTTYSVGNYFAYNDIVYKVDVDFTSETEFSTDNLTEVGPLCKLKNINLD